MRECPLCHKFLRLDAGNLPDHTDGDGDECAGANLPPELAQKEADRLDFEAQIDAAEKHAAGYPGW